MRTILFLVILGILLSGVVWASTMHPIEHLSPIRDATRAEVPFEAGVGSTQWVTDRGLVQAEPAYIINGRTYVPFRWAVELFGGEATWSSAEDGTTERVFLYGPPSRTVTVFPTGAATPLPRFVFCGSPLIDLSVPVESPLARCAWGVALMPGKPVELRFSPLGKWLMGLPFPFTLLIPSDAMGLFQIDLYFHSSPTGPFLSTEAGAGVEPVRIMPAGTWTFQAAQEGLPFGEVQLEIRENPRPYGPIGRGDFQGDPPAGEEQEEAAEIDTGFGYEPYRYHGSRTGTTYTATIGTASTYASMNRATSWMTLSPTHPDYPRLLNHEQRHFDISQAFAKKLKRVLESLIGRGNTPPAAAADLDRQIAQAYANLKQEWANEQAKYDQDTDHGRNQAKQAEWDQKIDGWAQTGYP
jgi:hypothetical protein